MDITESLILLTGFVGSFLGTYFIIPNITKIALSKQLMDNPNQRSSHNTAIPRLGGVAFVVCFIFGMFLMRNYGYENVRISMITGLLVLFLVGLKDDLLSVSPITKLVAQILACSFIFLEENFQLRSLHGFLDINNIHPILSITLIALLMVTIINAFNLIDGIDGLAATIAIIVFTSYGWLFYSMRQFFFLGLCIVGIGSLLAFLRYNISRKNSTNCRKKIFMGDTGSMILGFVIAVMTIKIITFDVVTLQLLPFYTENLPLIIGASLFVPLFDLVRVFTIRILKKRKPFSPDRKHLHHIVIDNFKISHRRASFFIGIANIILILLLYALAVWVDEYVMLLAFFISAFVFLLVIQSIDLSTSSLRFKAKLKRFFHL